MNFVYCDFETQSVLNLRKVGSKAYIEDASTRIMSGVFMVDGVVHTWLPYTEIKVAMPGPLHYGPDLPDCIRELEHTHTFVGHNAELFDAWLCDVKLNFRPQWMDTIHLARLHGLPAGLGNLLKVVLGLDKLDNTAMFMLTEAKVRGGRMIYPHGNTALWQKLANYNVQDVVHLENLVNTAFDCTDPVIPRHCEINARGFPVDLGYVNHLRKLWSECKEEATDEVARLTGGMLVGKDLQSPDKVKKWLDSVGYVLPGNSLDKKVVDRILADPTNADGEHELAISVLALRQNAVRSTVGKLDKLLVTTDKDGRCRRQITYGGAQTTLRFAGRETQPHNFARGVELPDLHELLDRPTLDDVKRVAGKHTVADALSTLTRACIRGNFAIADYAAIEARGVAWLSGCTRMLNAFADPKQDIYCDMASKLFGRPVTKQDEELRFIGKQIVLGCGYQMGAKKFGFMCGIYGVDLNKAGVTAEECVKSYRDAYSEVKHLWYALDDAMVYAVKHGRADTNGIDMEMHNGFLHFVLPSGRRIRYRDAHLEDVITPWGQTKEQVHYTNGYGLLRTLYGGLAAENIVQGLARDILCDALIKQDRVCLHVHDEIIAEDTRVEDLCKIMSTPPEWADDFPLGVEGKEATVYTKQKLKGQKSVKWLMGKPV